MSEDITQRLPEDGVSLILARLDKMEARFDRIETRLDNIETRLDSMENRIERLEARAYDTKPIWERALAELINLSKQMKELDKRMDSLDRRMTVLGNDVLQMRADHFKLEERVAALEPPRING